MRKFKIRCWFILLSVLAPAISSTQIESPDICKTGWISDMEAGHAEKRIQFRATPGTEQYDIYYHRLEWEVDPAEFYIKGSVTTSFTSNVAELSTLVFDLHHDLTVDSVLQRGQHLAYKHLPTHVLEITLPDPLSLGHADSVQVFYQGIPAQSGFGAFGQAMHADGPAVWTLSEPYGAKDWWPCKQTLNDKIDSIDVFVTTPSGNLVATNGVLMDSIPVGENHVKYHWKHTFPIPAYLIAIGVTNYSQFSDYASLDNGDSIEVLNYVYPSRLQDAKQRLGATVDLLELYNRLYGLYPFAREKYGHAQFGWGGGMEHQTMSFMGSFGVELQAHELAHQWFGDKVTCGSWQDIWLNEGFATYSVGLLYEETSPEQYWPLWKQIQVNSITSQSGGSVFVEDTSSVGRIFSGRLSYSKGAYLLHMIRWVVGDEAFFNALHSYLADPALAFGYARTDDLVRHLEEASGKDLEEFFDDWFYGEGYPSYHALITNGLGEDSISITLSQVTSHESVEFFEMPVPIRLLGPGGQDTTMVFPHVENGQVMRFRLSFEPVSAEIDPDLRLISRDNTVEFNQFVSTEDLKAYTLIRLMENPVQESYTILSDDLDGSEVAFTLFTADGSRADSFVASEFPLTRRMPKMSGPGFYTLNWQWAGKRGAIKLIVSK